LDWRDHYCDVWPFARNASNRVTRKKISSIRTGIPLRTGFSRLSALSCGQDHPTVGTCNHTGDFCVRARHRAVRALERGTLSFGGRCFLLRHRSLCVRVVRLRVYGTPAAAHLATRFGRIAAARPMTAQPGRYRSPCGDGLLFSARPPRALNASGFLLARRFHACPALVSRCRTMLGRVGAHGWRRARARGITQAVVWPSKSVLARWERCSVMRLGPPACSPPPPPQLHSRRTAGARLAIPPKPPQIRFFRQIWDPDDTRPRQAVCRDRRDPDALSCDEGFLESAPSALDGSGVFGIRV